MNDVQRKMYINKHIGETACTNKRHIITLGSGKICTYNCMLEQFCNKIYWLTSRSTTPRMYCNVYIRVQHNLTQAQRHVLSLSMVGKSVATIYTKRLSTIVSSRICPEVEKCGYNSYCKGLLLTLRKGKRKPLYEIKCEIDLKYLEGEINANKKRN